MEFPVEKFVSNFIESQFPSFYQEEGQDFILFMKAYYEWMENDWGDPKDGLGGPVREARALYDYRDIDNTLEKFLEFFQKKYLYGIPFNVIANKRFLLKHILDVYRSKGTIQCYRLLFKLLYNEDIEVYLPGRDVLRVSDGRWIQPKYLEVTNSILLDDLVGKTVIGASSGTKAVVESYVKENFNSDIVHAIYISNITPKGGDFIVGEKILDYENVNDVATVQNSPTVLGSLNFIEIVNGGQGYRVGDVIKVTKKDISNGVVISHGVGGVLRVTQLSTGNGALYFDLESGGFGFSNTAHVFVYKNGAAGNGAGFELGSLSSTQSIVYNTDIVCDYLSLTLDASTYGFPANASANLTSSISNAFSFSNAVFGSIFNLSNIKTGNGYLQSANVFVRSTIDSKVLTGTITYNTAANTITGSGTSFTSLFVDNDVIFIQANSSNVATKEYQVIKTVVSDTELTLFAAPNQNSTASAIYKASPTILPANFALYEPIMNNADDTINGENEIIRAYPNAGNNIVSSTIAISSGKGYIEGEQIKAYLFGAVSNTVTIVSGGNNYTNGEIVIFSGGGSPGTSANAFITTNGNGTIVDVSVLTNGSGYTTVPTLRVQSANGFGAVLTASLSDINPTSEILGKIRKGGLGSERGYWATTAGFLDADKYIQDSYYYQDYSYEIRVAQTLDKYKNILYNTFHTAGSELFGKYILRDSSESLIVDLDSSYTNAVVTAYLTSDSTFITVDNTVTVDKYYI